MNIYELRYDDYAWHVIAPTRGKARAEFIAYWDCEMEWTTPMGIRILEKNVDMPTGVDDNYLWARKNWVALYFLEFKDEMDDLVCQECAHLLWESEDGTAFCPDCTVNVEAVAVAP